MSTPLETKIRDLAMADSGLAGLLTETGGPFRWFDSTLPQGQPYPGVVQQLISDATSYSTTARLATSFCRMQFTIWGGPATTGQAACDDVENALTTFLDSMNLIGINNLPIYPNLVVNRRRTMFTETDTPVFQRIVDVKIFSNSTL